MIRLFLIAGLAWVGCCSLSANDFLDLEHLHTLAQTTNPDLKKPMVLSLDNSADCTDLSFSILRLGWATSQGFQQEAYGIYKVTEANVHLSSALFDLPIVCVEGNAYHGAIELLRSVLSYVNPSGVQAVRLSYISQRDLDSLQDILALFEGEETCTGADPYKVFSKKRLF
ncbi:MAG: hypothetical protein V6Z78_04370 [Holosporaceae bacterium]